MQPLEKPVAKRKFSSSCDTKADFYNLLIELRDGCEADKKKYDPNMYETIEEQNAFYNGQWFAYDYLLNELTKCIDTKKY